MKRIEAQQADRHFKVDHLNSDLGRRSLRSAGVTVAAEGVRFVLNFTWLVVMARLLTANEFGLVGMVVGVTGFVAVFKDFGLVQAVVQRPQIDHDQVNALFWINIAWSTGLSLLVTGLAPLVVWLYGEPQLFMICIALAAGPLLDGLAVQHQALLTRQMRFVSIAIVEIASFTGAIVLGIVAARWAGWSYWSLVVMQLGKSLFYMIGVWMFCSWRPGLPRAASGVRSMLAFGGHLSLFSLIDYFCRDLDKIIVGLVGGPQGVGLYTRAYNLMQLPMQQINAPLGRVAVPTLSRLANDPDRYRAAYLRAATLLMRILMPVAAICLFWGRELILLVLGPSWEQAVPIFQVLALATFVRPLGNFAGWILLSTGRADRMLRFRIATCWVSPSLFILGAYWNGVVGVAWGLVAGAFIIMPFWMAHAQKETRIGTLNMLKPAAAPFVCAIAAAAVVRFIAPFGTSVAMALTVMPILYLTLLCAASGSFNPLRDIEESFWMVLGRKPA